MLPPLLAAVSLVGLPLRALPLALALVVVTAPPAAPAPSPGPAVRAGSPGTGPATGPVTTPATEPGTTPVSVLGGIGPTAGRGRWLPPVGGLPPRPVHGFAAPPGPYAAGHRGVDLPAATGQVVRAPASGLVVFAASVAGRPVVVLAHPGGLRSTLEPVAASVAAGDTVSAGQAVGTLVVTGSHCLPAACLHWGVRAGTGEQSRYLDPLALLLGRGPVRLLPLDGQRPDGG